MRNIFDYYKQNENQLTHALFSTLDNDPALLRGFIKDICGVRGAPKNLHLSVQSYPFARAYTNKEIESRSIPDAWIYNNDGFALVFEAKITDTLKKKQLTSHQRTAEKQGFKKPRFYTITALSNAGDFDSWTEITWVSIYKWLRANETTYPLARHTADYFEILESRMHSKKSSQDFKMTTFTGFYPYYDDIYNHDLAKNTLKKAMGKLRTNKELMRDLCVNPKSGRDKITGKNEIVVWDFLSMGKANKDEKTNKDSIHLTLGINDKNVEATITIPNSINTYQKNKIKDLRIDGFTKCCKEILEKMEKILDKNSGAQPILRGLQRRYYPSQSSYPTMDTIIEADLRTAFPHRKGKEFPKHQDQWLETIYDVFCNKHSHTNYQIQVGIYFSYKKCKKIKTPDAIDFIADTWLACKPLIDACK